MGLYYGEFSGVGLTKQIRCTEKYLFFSVVSNFLRVISNQSNKISLADIRFDKSYAKKRKNSTLFFFYFQSRGEMVACM